MKVLLVTTAFPRFDKDVRTPFIFQQALALKKRGVDVRVLTPHHPGTPVYEELDGIKIHRLRYAFPETLEVLQHPGGGLPVVWKANPLARGLFIPMGIALALGTMKYGRWCDVIHAHWSLAAAAAWLGRFYHRRPIVTTVHGSDILILGKTAAGRWFNRFFLGKVEYVFANSKAMLKEAVAQGVPAQKMDLLPEAINIENFYPDESLRQPLVLFVGSLIPRKGANFLLSALGQILPQYPDYRAVIIGYGPEENHLKAQAAELGLSQRIEFIASESQEKIAEWMRRAKIFVLPALEEAQGIVVLEAQASGTPVIASQVGGIPEWISPESGILVPPGDPAALAVALRTLLEPTRWRSYNLAARTWAVEHFLTWDDIAERLIAAFQKVMKT